MIPRSQALNSNSTVTPHTQENGLVLVIDGQFVSVGAGLTNDIKEAYHHFDIPEARFASSLYFTQGHKVSIKEAKEYWLPELLNERAHLIDRGFEIEEEYRGLPKEQRPMDIVLESEQINNRIRDLKVYLADKVSVETWLEHIAYVRRHANDGVVLTQEEAFEKEFGNYPMQWVDMDAPVCSLVADVQRHRRSA